jgi:peptidoglycan/LPS O-acetylase OafA/YrhL
MARRYDLDWLRVIAFTLLILYHVGMVFVPWYYHIKNPQTSPQLEPAMLFVNQWRLPLLFLISGAAVRFSLRRRTAGEFALERLTRLGIPLVFSMLVVVPPQVYCERLTQGAGYPSFFHFYPDVFTAGPYPEGNLSWHHLWYVAYVLVYALLCLPLFMYLLQGSGARMLEKAGCFLEKPGRVYLIVLPLTISDLLLRPHWPTTNNLYADWANFTFSLIVFAYGFFISSAEALWTALRRHRWWAVGVGLVSATLLYGVFWPHEEIRTPAFRLAHVLVKNINMWSWLIAIFGFASKSLDRPSDAIRYANQAVYPFYILHQTVIIVFGYHLIRWEMSIPVKFSILVVVTFVVCWILYEFLIRRTNLTRVLFGMKPVKFQGR